MSWQSSSSDIMRIFYIQNLSGDDNEKQSNDGGLYFIWQGPELNNYMSQEEGFVKEDEDQVIDVNFVPYFPPLKHKPKSYMNVLKLQPQKLTPQESVFINKELQQELNNQFQDSHKGKIVYNYHRQQARSGKDKVLFQSRFDNGNLQYVVEEDGVYHLYIRPDTNTKSHNQWFYFTISNMSLTSISIVIHQFAKSHMLYRRGLKPYFKSQRSKDAHYRQITSPVIYEEDEERGYCLKFTFDFQHLFDEVQFTCQPPYSSLKLSNLLTALSFKTIEIAKSVLGQPINAVVVNEGDKSQGTIVVMARQHPGESVGSWMMEGLLRRLKQIQTSVCWIVIPMVNVDGVKLGNNRTGVLGHDLNRSWNIEEEGSHSHLYPELLGIIKFLKKMRKEKNKKIKMFIDLHGHSSQPNVFAYGPPHHQESEFYQNSRLFLCMLSQCNDNFKLGQCSFGMSEDKRNCARSVFFNKFGFPYSYTIESSFGVYKNRNINEVDMMRMGEDICSTANHFVSLLIDRKSSKLTELLDSVRSIRMDRLANDPQDNSDSDYDQPQEVFNKKITQILKDRIKNDTRKSQEKLSSQKDYAASLNVNEFVSMKKGKGRVNRMRTEDMNEHISQRNEYGRKVNVLLPSIKRIQVVKVAEKEERRAVSKNFNLEEVKQKLLSLRHHKTGKILVLNDYPTSFF